MHGIEEVVFNLTVLQYFTQAKRSTRPDVLPFAVEYEDAKIVTWTCAGHYFDFKDTEFHEVHDEDKYSAKKTRPRKHDARHELLTLSL